MQLWRKLKSISRNKNRIWVQFIFFDFVGIMIFAVVPYIVVLKKSFEYNGKISLQNYLDVLTNKAFLLAAYNSFRFVIICIPFLLISSFILAYCLSKWKKTGELMRLIFLTPMAIPVASAVLFWRVLFHQQGMLNRAIVMFGGGDIDWLNSEAAFVVLVICYIWKNIGYSIVLWMAGLQGISQEIYEAARMDGANEKQIIGNIVLPYIAPVAFTVILISVINSFKVYREAYLLAGEYPHESMYMLQHLFNNWFRQLEINKISAASVMITVLLCSLTFCLQRAWNKDG